MIVLVSTIMLVILTFMPDFNQPVTDLQPGACLKFENENVYQILKVDSTNERYVIRELRSDEESWLLPSSEINMSDLSRSTAEIKCPDVR